MTLFEANPPDLETLRTETIRALAAPPHSLVLSVESSDGFSFFIDVQVVDRRGRPLSTPIGGFQLFLYVGNSATVANATGTYESVTVGTAVSSFHIVTNSAGLATVEVLRSGSNDRFLWVWVTNLPYVSPAIDQIP